MPLVVQLLYVQLGVHFLMLLPCSAVHLRCSHRRLTTCVVVKILRSWIIIPGLKKLFQPWEDLFFNDFDGPVRFCIHLMLFAVINQKLLDALFHEVDEAVEIFDLGNVVGHGECASGVENARAYTKGCLASGDDVINGE